MTRLRSVPAHNWDECKDCNGSGTQFGLGEDEYVCAACDGYGGWEMEQLEADARRLLERTDVAEAWVKDDKIVVVNSYGEEELFDDFASAVTWLLGADAHLVGMALCPCLKCCTPPVPR